VFQFRRWRRRLYRRIVRLQGTPITLARGMGIGVIIGCVMPPGTQIAAVVPLAVLLRANVATAIAGTFISNPATFAPLYAFNCHVGRLFLDMFEDQPDITKQVEHFIHTVRHLVSGDAGMRAMLGCLIPIAKYWVSGGLIVGLASSVPSYYVTYLLVMEVRKLRDLRHARRRDRLRAREGDRTTHRKPEYDEEAADDLPPPAPE
jgi:hypothetical protein